MIVSELIKFGSVHLKRENIKSYALDSEILLSKVLGKSREEILIEFDEKIDFEAEKKFKRLIKRRSAKEELLDREYPPVWSEFSVEIVNKTILMSDFGFEK